MSSPQPTTYSASQRAKGIVFAMLSPIAFGFIPLFTVPLLKGGYSTPTILAYRFTIAAVLLLMVIVMQRKSLRVTRSQIKTMLLLGAIYFWSATGLQVGYNYMSTGLATVIHFTYPIYVVLILLFVYRQKPGGLTLLAIVGCILGVALQAGIFNQGEATSWKGIGIVASTGIAYAAYMVVLSKSSACKLNPFVVSFYVLSTTSILFFAYAGVMEGGVQLLRSSSDWYNITMLSIVSTVLANILLVPGIKYAGATLNAVMGALEPLTAVVIGVIFLNESLGLFSIIGIVLIVLSVLLIGLSGKIAYTLKVRKLRRRHR